MINKFKKDVEYCKCPACDTPYVLFKSSAPDIPFLHGVCITCWSPMEVANPFYIEEVEYVCVEEKDVQTSRTLFR